jgi:carboxylate-amine ligase
MDQQFTIGIEEEYQIIDPETGELTSYIQRFLERSETVLRDQVKPEFMQSQVEVGSEICRNIKEARLEVMRLRRAVSEIAEENGRKIVSAGTHPFSKWIEQEITARDRYYGLAKDMGHVARRLLIFGMHVHIGIEDPELRIDIMNQVRYFLPHILALSTSSPFWQGRDTKLKSYRSVIFEDLPRTGIPGFFNSHGDYDRYIETLTKTRCIDEPTKIWWDVRPHSKFPTLEFRVCDACTKLDEAIAIAALFQAVVAKLVQLRRDNQTWRIYRTELIAENKWRAIREGIDGKLIDFGIEQEVPLRFLINELLELIDDVVDDLGSRQEVEYVQTILGEGSSADRQLRVYRETGDFKAVVDMLAEETMQGCC